MSSLSTIGSNSFGMAFVAGRNRLPKSTTENTVFANFIHQVIHLTYLEIANDFEKILVKLPLLLGGKLPIMPKDTHIAGHCMAFTCHIPSTI
jgi:hypothetical protein